MLNGVAPLRDQPAPAQGGWQIILADLALILFMITAAALANAPDGAQSPFKPPAAPAVRPSKPIAPSFRGEPVAVWTDAEGAPPLAEWLTSEGSDARLRPTIVVRFVKGHQAAAFLRAEMLAKEVLAKDADKRGENARIIVEAGPRDGAVVSLAYDLE